MIHKNTKHIILESKKDLSKVKSVLNMWNDNKGDTGFDEEGLKILQDFLFKKVGSAINSNYADMKKVVVPVDDSDEDGAQDAQQSVSNYDYIYRKLLFEANKQQKRLAKLIFEEEKKDAPKGDSEDENFSDSAKVIKMVVKGNSIKFSTKQDDGKISPEEFQRLQDSLKGKYAELVPGKAFHTSSKSLDDADKEDAEKNKQAIIDGIKNAEIDVDSLKTENILKTEKDGQFEVSDSFQQVYKKIAQSICATPKILLKKLIDAKADFTKPEDVANGVATLISCLIIGKAAAMAKGMNKKSNTDKANKETAQKKQGFIEAAKQLQAQLPATQLAEVCDLWGATDVYVSPNTKLYDVNGKEINKWDTDSEIDSSEQKEAWANFLKTNADTDTPAHPETIAAALAQQMAGLCEAYGTKLDGFDASMITTGLAGALATGGLALPLALRPVLKNSMNSDHVKKGSKLIQTWYNKALDIMDKYPQFKLDKIGKKDQREVKKL